MTQRLGFGAFLPIVAGIVGVRLQEDFLHRVFAVGLSVRRERRRPAVATREREAERGAAGPRRGIGRGGLRRRQRGIAGD